MMADHTLPERQSMLLRLWPQRDGNAVRWRASVQTIPGGERIGFGDMVDLLIYLESLTPTHAQPSKQTRRMTMTPRQITLVKESFAQVEPIADVAARLFYDRLFTIAPQVKPLFAHTDMDRQRMSLMATLAVVVKNLDDPDVVLPAAGNLGSRHQTVGVQPEHYPLVGAALLWTLEQGLGEAFTDEVRAAWTEAYALLAEVMQGAPVAAD